MDKSLQLEDLFLCCADFERNVKLDILSRIVIFFGLLDLKWEYVYILDFYLLKLDVFFALLYLIRQKGD